MSTLAIVSLVVMIVALPFFILMKEKIPAASFLAFPNYVLIIWTFFDGDGQYHVDLWCNLLHWSGYHAVWLEWVIPCLILLALSPFAKPYDFSPQSTNRNGGGA